MVLIVFTDLVAYHFENDDFHRHTKRGHVIYAARMAVCMIRFFISLYEYNLGFVHSKHVSIWHLQVHATFRVVHEAAYNFIVNAVFGSSHMMYRWLCVCLCFMYSRKFSENFVEPVLMVPGTILSFFFSIFSTITFECVSKFLERADSEPMKVYLKFTKLHFEGPSPCMDDVHPLCDPTRLRVW